MLHPDARPPKGEKGQIAFLLFRQISKFFFGGKVGGGVNQERRRRWRKLDASETDAAVPDRHRATDRERESSGKKFLSSSPRLAVINIENENLQCAAAERFKKWAQAKNVDFPTESSEINSKYAFLHSGHGCLLSSGRNERTNERTATSFIHECFLQSNREKEEREREREGMSHIVRTVNKGPKGTEGTDRGL